MYRLSLGQRAQQLLLFLLLDAAVSFLFFDSGIVMLLLFSAYPFYRKACCTWQLEKQQRGMRGEFLDAMQILGNNLQTGYAIENAIAETVTELGRIYPRDAFIMREFTYMQAQLSMNRTAEELFSSLAARCRLEEIETFAELFVTTRRTGGDLISVVRNTSSSMRQRMETRKEIETILAGKVMEHRIMSLMPLFILGYVRLSSPDFLRPVYHTTAGICLMSVCLDVYTAAFLWGRKIVDISV